MKPFYSKHHIRAEAEGDLVTLALTPFARGRIGEILFVTLPEAGERLEAGERFGDIESAKTVSDLISPVSGEVVAVNEAALDDPETLNEADWLVRVREAEFAEEPMDALEYEAYCKTL